MQSTHATWSFGSDNEEEAWHFNSNSDPVSKLISQTNLQEKKASFYTVLCDYENEAEQTFEGWGGENHRIRHLKTIMAFYEL